MGLLICGFSVGFRGGHHSFQTTYDVHADWPKLYPVARGVGPVAACPIGPLPGATRSAGRAATNDLEASRRTRLRSVPHRTAGTVCSCTSPRSRGGLSRRMTILSNTPAPTGRSCCPACERGRRRRAVQTSSVAWHARGTPPGTSARRRSAVRAMPPPDVVGTEAAVVDQRDEDVVAVVTSQPRTGGSQP
jgi:hypothetical protein